MSALLGIQERTPPAHRPMSVGMGETVHRTTNVLVSLLLDDVHKTCTREWSRVLPLVHYVMMCTPILESGLVPRDLERAWSLRDHAELPPFFVLLAVSQWTSGRRRCSRGETSFARHLAMTEEKRAELYDWVIGERHPTMRLGGKFQPCSVGPYELRAVQGQRATLRGEDGTLISNIPLAELARVPARVFVDDTDLERRSVGQIVGGQSPAPVSGPKGKLVP